MNTICRRFPYSFFIIINAKKKPKIDKVYYFYYLITVKYCVLNKTGGIVPKMNDDKITIELMKKNISGIKKGTLRFWGEWFGRPMDNYHIIVNIQFNSQDDILVLEFNEGETLKVWNPVNINSDPSEFYIRSATKIRWEWFSYGQSRINKNLYYNQYEKQGSSIVVSRGKGTLDYIGKKIIKVVGQHAVEIC